MKRSASEIFKNLEDRIDRLEDRTASKSAHKASLEALKQAEIAGTALFRFLHQINLINASDDSEHTKNLVAQGKKLKKCEELITDAFIKAQKVRTHLEDQHNLHFRRARLEKSARSSDTAIDFFCTSFNPRKGTCNFRNSQGVNIFFDVDNYGSPMIRGNQRLHIKEGIYDSINAMMEEYGKTNYYQFTEEVADAVGMYLNGKGQTLGSILDHYYDNH